VTVLALLTISTSASSPRERRSAPAAPTSQAAPQCACSRQHAAPLQPKLAVARRDRGRARDFERQRLAARQVQRAPPRARRSVNFSACSGTKLSRVDAARVLDARVHAPAARQRAFELQVTAVEARRPLTPAGAARAAEAQARRARRAAANRRGRDWRSTEQSLLDRITGARAPTTCTSCRAPTRPIASSPASCGRNASRPEPDQP